mmetsp:Transcript_10373/g.11776  ORF Transcript_10373/g.11776 Transcript_10373/m.11776 type:complete len:100 (+) Transcript_10373:414-713(+)|eukprot:CAMPEP_0204825060 /NCGR_PEP_ID=MMETSP1346-20131115/3025_1 /ASSEMBLY_ACC=CAM_ASM_000771 /TAXON_ID=215587 /ORGANISM="Aplanochytrium stocchinoi, Strain GSBS06" /LENGTH=99 /DNA_ID=CAMNT_0051952555 /DNA_START=584 /DNA_END=883 /DNA_ORIENTATION=-
MKVHPVNRVNSESELYKKSKFFFSKLDEKKGNKYVPNMDMTPAENAGDHALSTEIKTIEIEETSEWGWFVDPSDETKVNTLADTVKAKWRSELIYMREV